MKNSPRLSRARLLIGLLPLLSVIMAASLEAQQGSAGTPILYEPVVPKVFDGDLRRAPKTRTWREGEPYREVEDLKEQKSGTQKPGAAAPSTLDLSADPQTSGAGPGLSPTFSPVSFDGISATGWVPPDPVGDIGPNHYVQAVNISFAMYDRMGNTLVGPSPINALWAGFGGPCETNNNGDPIVRYDRQADRWLVSQFALGINFQCVAISRTPDPVAGGWYLYAFPTAGFPDYPKIGVWPDGYYMGTQRGFPGGGLDVYAFDRIKMLSGLPAGAVRFFIPAPSLFLQPSDLDGPPPPTGTPNLFVRHVDGNLFGGVDRLEMFAFHADWASPAASTFTALPSLPVAPFDATFCGDSFAGNCVQQPGTAMRLETLPAWLMYRLQYRNFGTHETLVTNHTINTGGDHAGVRWYELRRTGGGPWSVFQQGTHAPDAVNRWMGSAAMDKDGSMAIGYSVASSTVFPGIRYAGRVATDVAGTLPLPETTLVNGAGSQTGASRWGNYSALDLDPVDDCTFWYTTEYYSATSAAGWRTRVSSFQLPTCGGTPTPPIPASLPNQVSMFVGGLLTDNALPLNAGFDTGFRYRRQRFLPLWSWEFETATAFLDNPVNSGVLASVQGHIVRHLNSPSSKIQPFVMGGFGFAHYDSLGFSDSAPLLTLGIGADFVWTQRVGFRADIRTLWMHGMITSGWTRNWQVLWGPTFSF